MIEMKTIYLLLGVAAILYLYYRTLPMGVIRLRKYRKRRKKKQAEEALKHSKMDDKLKQIEPPAKPPLYDGNDADESQLSLDDRTIKRRRETVTARSALGVEHGTEVRASRSSTMESVWGVVGTATPSSVDSAEFPALPEKPEKPVKHAEDNDMLPALDDQTVRVIKIVPSKQTSQPAGKKKEVKSPNGWTTVERVAYEPTPAAPAALQEQQAALSRRQRQDQAKREKQKELKRIIEQDRLKRLNAHRLSQMKAMFG